MALCRCKEKHSNPKGREFEYVESKYPIGYPNDTSSICGIKDCENAGLIWLTQQELDEYNDNEENRIFSYLSAVSKVKVK